MVYYEEFIMYRKFVQPNLFMIHFVKSMILFFVDSLKNMTHLPCGISSPLKCGSTKWFQLLTLQLLAVPTDHVKTSGSFFAIGICTQINFQIFQFHDTRSHTKIYREKKKNQISRYFG